VLRAGLRITNTLAERPMPTSSAEMRTPLVKRRSTTSSSAESGAPAARHKRASASRNEASELNGGSTPKLFPPRVA
jgi:hypothetical protein